MRSQIASEAHLCARSEARERRGRNRKGEKESENEGKRSHMKKRAIHEKEKLF